MDEDDEKFELVQQAANKLMEHFDTVQIFDTKLEDGEDDSTRRMAAGKGNFYARYGHVSLWLDRMQAKETSAEDDE